MWQQHVPCVRSSSNRRGGQAAVPVSHTGTWHSCCCSHQSSWPGALSQALQHAQQKGGLWSTLFYLDRLYSIFLLLSEGICRDIVLDSEFSYILVWWCCRCTTHTLRFQRPGDWGAKIHHVSMFCHLKHKLQKKRKKRKSTAGKGMFIGYLSININLIHAHLFKVVSPYIVC